MEREACVCDHGFERSDLCAEIILIINNDQDNLNRCPIWVCICESAHFVLKITR